MQLSQIARTSALLSLFVMPSRIGLMEAQTPDARTKSDNTAVNKRDRTPGGLTAEDQKMNTADREISAKIRRSIMADKTLSMYAKNIKIISQNGTVTLKGPVRTDAEVKSILTMANAVGVGASKVVNQMSVAPKS